MTEFYLRVSAKYEWAQKHVEKLETAIDQFRRANPHTIRCEDDLENGQVTFFVEEVPTVPDEITLLLGDAIHNLRSTLDHLAYALVEASGGTTNKNTAFPIFDDEKKYKDLSAEKVPGLGQPSLQKLETIQPWKGGKGHMLWQLHQLDIVDKHRLLLTVCTTKVGRTMTSTEKAAFRAKRTIVGPHTFAALQHAHAFANPDPILQAGDKLGTFPAAEGNMGFSFGVAINEPNVVEGLPSFLLLRNFSSEVSRILRDFEPCLV